jgi:peptide/nickel transport system substrate-binding protein
MDDANWPIDDMNVLDFVYEIPWPDWWQYSVYQPLVATNLTSEYQQGTIQYLPVLAANWTVSPDETTYTFNLRQGVTFSNGDPFNAYQVWGEMYGFYYLSGNSSGWFQSYPLYDMSNVKFGPSTISLMTSSGLVHPTQALLSIMEDSSWPIYVTSPYQIVFHERTPTLVFLGTFVSYMGMMFDTQFVLNNGGFGTPSSFNTYFNQHAVPGTGPYEITGILENSYVKFAQNPSYWGNSLTPSQIAANPVLDPGHVKNVIIYYKVDDVARYTDLSTGAAQVVAIISADWNLITSNPSKYAYTVLPPWSMDTSAIALNVNEYPTNITAVRQAIVHAINYTDLIDKAFFGQVTRGVGPEYPTYGDFYDLGNYSPYQYNLTLAKQYLQQAHITNMPTITFRTVAGCTYCDTAATVVQADLANIGIPVNIVELAYSAYWAPIGSYSTNVQNAQQLGQLSLLGGTIWAPSAVTPGDAWVSFVSNSSSWGNWAGYSNPTVQACVNAFTSSSSVSQVQALCKPAQAQIYNDAPYAWIGYYKLWYVAGSLAWQKGVISGFYLDPAWNGIDTMPLINTVTFG